MVFIEVLYLVMLNSNIVIGDTSSCVSLVTDDCTCAHWSGHGPCIMHTSHGSLLNRSCVGSCFDLWDSRSYREFKRNSLCAGLTDRSHNCKLTRLSHEISTLLSTNIVSLTINANIESIDPGILNKFAKLQCINLAGNLIKEISSTVFMNLTKLKKLDLGSNQIG